MSVSRGRAELLLILTTLLWAGTFAIVKDAMNTVHPLVFVFLRFGSAAIIAAAIWRASLHRIRGRLLQRGTVLGILFAVGFILQVFGLTQTTATTSAFITGTMVAWVPLVNIFIGGKRIEPLNWLSLILVIGGLWLFTQPDFSNLNPGDVYTLISAIVWAVYMVALDRWTGNGEADAADGNALVVMQFGVTAAISGAFMVFQGVPLHLGELSLNAVAAIAYCSILASVVTTWIQTRFQHYTHPLRAGIIFTIEPLAAAVIAVYALEEPFERHQWIGATIICAALVLPDLIQLLISRNDKARTA